MSDDRDELRILAPIGTKRRLDAVVRDVQAANAALGRRALSRREALGLGGLALLAAACGGTTNAGGGGGAATSIAPPTTGGGGAGGSSSAALPPADTTRKLEDQLVIYNWSEYDDPSTYKHFKAAHAGLKLSETYYASNDELIAKLQAGGGNYDIVVPTQNAVKQLGDQGKLMLLQKELLPNLANVDPAWTNLSYDPGNRFSVIKDYGVTLFFYRNDIVTERPKTMLDFYNLLPKYGKTGRTNIMEGAEEVVPLALAALGEDPNTGDEAALAKAKDLLKKIRPGVTTITSSNYIADGSAGKIVLGQGWSGDIRRIVQARKKAGKHDITAVLPTGNSERWADNWCIVATAKHPVAAHAWINNIMDPKVAVTEMEYHNYPIPIPKAIEMCPPELKNDPLFNLDQSIVSKYTFILNPNPQVVNARTKLYTEFKAG
jgi:spermidine/putrescine transport system substrate-binding protein